MIKPIPTDNKIHQPLIFVQKTIQKIGTSTNKIIIAASNQVNHNQILV